MFPTKFLQRRSGLGDPSNGEPDVGAELGARHGPQDHHTVPGLVRGTAGEKHKLITHLTAN
jgi:hypothetical protein